MVMVIDGDTEKREEKVNVSDKETAKKVLENDPFKIRREELIDGHLLFPKPPKTRDEAIKLFFSFQKEAAKAKHLLNLDKKVTRWLVDFVGENEPIQDPDEAGTPATKPIWRVAKSDGRYIENQYYKKQTSQKGDSRLGSSQRSLSKKEEIEIKKEKGWV